MSFTPLIALPDLSLRNVQLEFNGTIFIDATKITIKRTAEDQDRTAGSSTVKQRVLGPQDAEIEVEGWNGHNFSFADVPFGTLCTGLTLMDTEATPVSILQSDFFTKNPPTSWVVISTETTIDNKPGMFKMTLKPNCLAVS